MWHHVPFDINGTERFGISCSGNEWATKTKDGRYWQTSCSKNKNLNGFCQVSKCKGSMCCTYEKCPCQLAKKSLNTKVFNCIAGHFTCKICGHFIEQKWYRAKRTIEYDNERQLLSMWHQGQHNCTLPCKNEAYEEKEEKKNILREIVNKNPRVPRVKVDWPGELVLYGVRMNLIMHAKICIQLHW